MYAVLGIDLKIWLAVTAIDYFINACRAIKPGRFAIKRQVGSNGNFRIS